MVCAAAVKLRMEAKSHEGSKMAKRKHQIGTLFFNAKMKVALQVLHMNWCMDCSIVTLLVCVQSAEAAWVHVII